MPGTPSNQPLGVFTKWHENDLQKISQSSLALNAYSRAYGSEHFTVSTSYLRLKTMSFYYNIPPKFLPKTKINSFKFFIELQNLITLTNYNGLNVEFPGGSTSPSLRTITSGFQFNF